MRSNRQSASHRGRLAAPVTEAVRGGARKMLSLRYAHELDRKTLSLCEVIVFRKISGGFWGESLGEDAGVVLAFEGVDGGFDICRG